jgi:hypothetical protein
MHAIVRCKNGILQTGVRVDLMTSVDAFARPFYVCVLRLIIPHYFWFKKGWLLSRSTTLAHMVSFIVILFAQRLSRFFLTMTLLGRPLGA